MKRWMKWVLGWFVGLCLAALLFVAAVLQMLRAQPGEWAQPLRVGPLQTELSIPTLLRMASHPFVLRLLENHTLRTPHGPLTLRAAHEGIWLVSCEPCLLRVADANGDEVRRLDFQVRPGEGDVRRACGIGGQKRRVPRAGRCVIGHKSRGLVGDELDAGAKMTTELVREIHRHAARRARVRVAPRQQCVAR